MHFENSIFRNFVLEISFSKLYYGNSIMEIPFQTFQKESLEIFGF